MLAITQAVILNPTQDNHNVFASVLPVDENSLILIFSGITKEFIASLSYFYRRMSELNITDTEYALLTATTVLFSGTHREKLGSGDFRTGNH